MRSRKFLLIILLLVLLGFGLRVKNLDSFSFWIDEGLTPLRSGYSIVEILSNRITIQEGIGKDTHPPLHYLLIHFSRRWFGESDFAYRYPSVLAGALLIPLIFQLARQIDEKKTGLLAALLTAINPLQVWYGQEARMYTMLVLLAAGASYALWRALSNHSLPRYLALYTLLAGLALYTHYTAVFLIAGQSLFWIWLLWQKGHRRLLFGVGVLSLLVALPLVPFTIPRLFTGAEANYQFVPPWIMLQDVVHGFGLGLTVDFGQIGIKLLDAVGAILALIGLVSYQRKPLPGHLARTFLLTYLLAAVVGLMIGSFVKPMYMGARHIIIGSPAFLIALARGVVSIGRLPHISSIRWMARGAPVAGIVILVLGPVHSLNNLYHDPSYAKDDFRALFEFVDRHAGGNDLLLLNNAIHLPLYEHYQSRSDITVTALPTYPYVSSPKTEQALVTLMQEYNRFWFIDDLPAEGRDDKQIVHNWVDQNLIPLNSFWSHGRNFEAKVTTLSAKSATAAELPANAMPLDFTWDTTPAPQGILLDFDQPADLPTLWFELFWRYTLSPNQKESLHFSLRGPDGKVWAEKTHPSTQTTLPYPQDSFAREMYDLSLPAGMPPGDYELLLAVSDESGTPFVEATQLATIQLAPTDAWPIQPDWPFDQGNSLIFDNDIELVGLSYVKDEVRPGHALPLSIYWRSPAAPADLQYQLDVVGANGEIVHGQTGTPGVDWLKPDEWPANSIIVNQTGIYFRPESEPGRYQLRWSLFAGETAIPGRPAWRPWSSNSIVLGHIDLQPWPLETELPTDGHTIQAQLGSAIELHSYQLSGDLVPDSSLEVKLVWLAHQVPTHSYRVFVHLVSAADGAIASQQDQIPMNWLRPTNGWREGEVLSDYYILPIPDDLAAGIYHLFTGMYDPTNKQRLPITYQGIDQPNQQLMLTQLEAR